MLRALEADDRVGRLHLVTSPSALRVLAEELNINGRSGLVEKLLGRPSAKVITDAFENIGAAIASGSYPVDAMIVLPCSMGTLAAIAHGLAANLTERAADVCLKERRPLVLCVRETPLNLIHLRNMATVTEAGAIIFPVIPTFYNGPETVAEVVRCVCGARSAAHRPAAVRSLSMGRHPRAGTKYLIGFNASIFLALQPFLLPFPQGICVLDRQESSDYPTTGM